jgi:hypothetical protein
VRERLEPARAGAWGVGREIDHGRNESAGAGEGIGLLHAYKLSARRPTCLTRLRWGD